VPLAPVLLERHDVVLPPAGSVDAPRSSPDPVVPMSVGEPLTSASNALQSHDGRMTTVLQT
jgi:hypothetical protein